MYTYKQFQILFNHCLNVNFTNFIYINCIRYMPVLAELYFFFHYYFNTINQIKSLYKDTSCRKCPIHWRQCFINLFPDYSMKFLDLFWYTNLHYFLRNCLCLLNVSFVKNYMNFSCILCNKM